MSGGFGGFGRKRTSFLPRRLCGELGLLGLSGGELGLRLVRERPLLSRPTGSELSGGKLSGGFQLGVSLGKEPKPLLRPRLPRGELSGGFQLSGEATVPLLPRQLRGSSELGGSRSIGRKRAAAPLLPAQLRGNS